MYLFTLLISSLLCNAAWADSHCPHDPTSGKWSQVDCQKIQLPYAGNSLIPPNPGPFSPPKPLDSAPTKSNPSMTKDYFNQISAILKGTEKGSTDCKQCTSTYQKLHEAAHQISPSDITTLLSQLCSAGFHLFGGPCTGPDSIYGGSASEGPYLAKLFYLLNENTQDIQALCTWKQASNCSPLSTVKIRESDWFKTSKPAQGTSPPPPCKNCNDSKPFGVVHMSDFHLDSRYSITPETPRWGTYGSDSPGDLILSAFSTMSSLVSMDDIEFSIFTGDIVNHGNDNQLSEDYVKFEEESVFNAFKAEMKNKKGEIPLYASLGNHDSYPEMYANSDSSWNYDFLSSLWKKNGWIDSAAAKDVVTHFGAYAISNPSGMQGLKVISINTDFWYVDNIFNYANYSNPDPNGMLQFLISELEESEAAKQRVWIIGHVPSGYASGSALPNPTALFQSIVVRFSPSTIAAIFWGHTHEEQKQIFYEYAADSLENGVRDTSKIDTSKPVNMAWIGPSLTSQASPVAVNPAWSYYEVDPSTYSIVNARTYFSDLSGASEKWTVAPFKLEYDTRKAYDPKGSWPADQPLDSVFWDKYLAQKVETDKDVAEMYNKYEVRGSPREAPCTSAACLKYKKCCIQAGTADAGNACKSDDPNGANDPN